MAVLEAGKHVMVEKPLATTVADGPRHGGCRREGRRQLMVDFHARWHPLFMGAKAYVERGELGAPVMAYARLSDTIYVPTEMLTGAASPVPSGSCSRTRWTSCAGCSGATRSRSYAKGYRGVLERRGIACWDAMQALVEFEGGAFGTFETSWIVPNSYTNVVDNRLTLYGEKGGLEIKNEPKLWAFTDRFHTPFSSESVTRYGKAWGYPVRADPLLHRLRGRRRDARGERPRRPDGDGDDRSDAEIAFGEAPGPNRRRARVRTWPTVRRIR